MFSIPAFTQALLRSVGVAVRDNPETLMYVVLEWSTVKLIRPGSVSDTKHATDRIVEFPTTVSIEPWQLTLTLGWIGPTREDGGRRGTGQRAKSSGNGENDPAGRDESGEAPGAQTSVHEYRDDRAPSSAPTASSLSSTVTAM